MMTSSAHRDLQLSSAQKDADDPSSPVDARRETEPGPFEYTSLAVLAADVEVGNAGTPSYSKASGPMYLRASSEAMPLPDHMYRRGFLEGRHSDITVNAFGKSYSLHRLVLDRAPFFTSALSEPWLESRQKEITIYPDQIDNNITQASFELAIKRLYGYDISNECDGEAIGLFATGCWLETQDLVDLAIESILRQMTPGSLAPLIRLVTHNYYGRSGDRILESAKAMLSRTGWEMPLRYWDGMPGDVVRELVASDGFYVYSEWDRWVLAKRLLDRRLRQAAMHSGLIERGKSIPKAPDGLRLMAIRFNAVYRQNSMTLGQSMSDHHAPWVSLYTDPDIEPILVLLDEGIHYMHMEYEQLDFLRGVRDIFGLPVLPEKVISDALWQQLALRQMVLNADESAQELGLCKTPPQPSSPPLRFKEKQKATISSDDTESDPQAEGWDGTAKPRKFWIPSSDCNIVLGNGADPVVTTSHSFQRHANRLSATIQPEDAQWATDFASSPANMANPNTRADPLSRPISAGGSNAGQPKPFAFTEFPPFRFSAEFPNPRSLKEKKRVYSRTVFYAGSLWNIYIQKVRTAKNVQLGVYLHRAKEREADEQPGSGLSQQNTGSVDERIGQLERAMILRSERGRRVVSARNLAVNSTMGGDEGGSGSEADATLVATGSRNHLFASRDTRLNRDNVSAARWSSADLIRSASPVTTARQSHSVDTYSASDEDSSDSHEDEPASAYPNPSLVSHGSRKSRGSTPTLPPYVDRRPTIKTYFKIYSPSKGGRVLSIYESAPDRFNFSQSWGWKSSTLMLDEGVVGGSAHSGSDDFGEVSGKKKSEGTLRFMVVIGNL
ncbi:uncharacterized protein EI97DRAFT_431325 [Westerdykella ornata]|uniref:BTB domain-containing protein n=1 Tax=Westerdykella ornata TaxID=318751 RepID=A0A6A6JR54_WESOR|nr:uncharacterized protein EI97DRAFT_431325 [Westerdykella ornata]KAF2279111.1 hypothetical protein EI97DRAFT_431325 [Westerdykella ornata]